jgi:hypothetical protein
LERHDATTPFVQLTKSRLITRWNLPAFTLTLPSPHRERVPALPF